MKEGFLLTSRMAELFFRTCKRYRIDNYNDRVSLMRKLVKRKQARYLPDGEAFLKGKRVLHVTSKPRRPECSN